MRDFSGKKIIGSFTLGERLARLRQEGGFSVEEIEKKLGIQKNYLVALEKSKYQKLPGEVYTINFLKKYAQFLQVNPEMVLSLYRQEHQIFSLVKKEKKPTKAVRSIITPLSIRYAIIIIITIGLLLYLGLQIKTIFAPPNLTIDSPPDNLVTNQSSIKVSGKTEPEVQITINGQPVLADLNGNFSKTVDLQEGVNTIKIAVSKEKSQTRIITRQILYKKEDGNDN